ncbi:FecR family protein [Flavivirga spongiicola]|uniref:DUF4974 domain-containing protein n=1 Tax=Flavivirga spongiicola TaxID=421621 RepID=A0ABU7XUR6_9FLAO|nr:FecR domain-containing protein [Flavivirga sp. MEBiC05379]MDO5978587.1 DUF4974 domain-containing protein [Flavivirga sp. MEBiC05379]
MKHAKIEIIIVKFLNREINEDELKTLEIWLSNANNARIFNRFVRTDYITSLNTNSFDLSEAKKSVKNRLRIINKSKKQNLIKRLSIAAIIALLIALPILLNNNKTDTNKPIIVKNNIETGTDKATLTLEDGTDITLEKGQNYVADNIISNGEKLIYNTPKATNQKIVYNYLTIPRGGQYFVKLSDGTQVWLNSESKLKYPVNFVKGETRMVELIYGEAYFDVSPSTHHKGALFKVKSRMQELEVLGTKFNIKSYQDEHIVYTTLVEGKVAVDNGSKSAYLEPNQQSQISLSNKNIIVENIDVYNATSWVNGVFSFESKPLKDIMKVLSRWYDMDVVFVDKKIEDIKFIGVLSKNQNIEDILITIKELGFINSYKINDKKIILK